MAVTGRYFYTPAAGRIRGLHRSLLDRILMWLKKGRNEPDLFPVTGYYAMIYPEGYKK